MKKNIKYSITFIVIFFSGILFERYQLDNKIINLFKDTLNGSYRIIYSLTNSEKIVIDIENKHYEKIIETRNKALKLGVLKEEMQKWSPAKLKINDNSHDIKIRLKGAFPDHWSDLSKLSFIPYMLVGIRQTTSKLSSSNTLNAGGPSITVKSNALPVE